jgi:endonuclease YncB( thermonuclease family)
MKYLIFLGIGLLLNLEVLAHQGNLNKNGCHNNLKTDQHHCHQGLNSLSEDRISTQETIIGIPEITDGDTIKIGRIRIRLHGIDAPEAKQTCSNEPKEWLCGWEATNALANIIGNHWVTCTKHEIDRYGRVIAVCKVGPINLNAWMVSNGWAVAYRRYSLDYVQAEKVAKNSRAGIWRGEFTMPWEWRKAH